MTLTLTIGQFSDKGRKEINQDFHGAILPEEPLLTTKGVAVVIADGISSSPVSRAAAETTVKSFLTDYYCTSEAWSVKTAAHRVIAATNSWLHAQTRRSLNPHDRDKGYVCTVAAVVFKSRTAHVFHAGDSRVQRLVGASLEPLTEDHRIAVSSAENYLARALGVRHDVELDYRTQPFDAGDVSLLTTDGVHDHITGRDLIDAIAQAPDLDIAAKILVDLAFERGSTDNLTAQIVRVEAVPKGDADELMGSAARLPVPPLLEARADFEGYTIVRKLYGSARSHVYLAQDNESHDLVVVKTPSIDLATSEDNLKRFLMEDWVARRISSAHVLKPRATTRARRSLHIVTEYVEGQTLAQWMTDHPRPELEQVRSIIDQIARGLQAFHRLEMLHQDLRPANIMIDRNGTAKIIDFGSVRVAGVMESAPALDPNEVLGTAQYTAPEYFLGEGGTAASDNFSLGVIAYHMLTGRLPYGAKVAGARTRKAQRSLRYTPAQDEGSAIPAWMDAVLEKAVSIDPARRFEEPLEFAWALRHPPAEFVEARRKPLMERNPLLFWKLLSLVLGIAVVVLAFALFRR